MFRAAAGFNPIIFGFSFRAAVRFNPIILAFSARLPLTSTPNPATTDRENLTHKAIGVVAGEIRAKHRIFARADEPTQRHLALKPFLKRRIGLHFGRKIRGVIDKVLSNCVDLNLLARQFGADCTASRRLLV